ncbi:hypothetical protein SETIT_5G323900v2 [Setaria italica]|uniref:Uncharacterized protein n=2 Tax=Setaria TaxID=4554 RepID=A0A368RB58_SETIT|nr:hypothetical protein SETIT_5G323900v2 [Setaria italica]TKW16861.1 hypothetical protein SEVIR_5G327401v2 [Setaria viridis]
MENRFMEKRAPGCGSTCSAAGHGGPRDPSRWRRDPMRLRRTDPSWTSGLLDGEYRRPQDLPAPSPMMLCFDIFHLILLPCLRS